MPAKKISKSSKKKRTVRYAAKRDYIKDEGLDFVTTFKIHKTDSATALADLTRHIEKLEDVVAEFADDRSIKRKVAQREIGFAISDILDSINFMNDTMTSMNDVVAMVEEDLIPLITKRAHD